MTGATLAATIGPERWMEGPFGLPFAPLVAGVLIVAVVVLGLVVARGDDRAPRPSDDAREVLRQRFARGEIDEDEYDRRRRVLDDEG